MTPDEILLFRTMWSDYRRARRRNKGRWLSASRDARRNVALAKRILLDAYARWAKE